MRAVPSQDGDDRPGRTAGERNGQVLTDGGRGVTFGGEEGEEPTDAGGGTDVPAAVPPDAVAVDVACPHCGERPVESVAKGYRITGMVLLMRVTTLRFVGCQPCIRRKLLGAAGRNLLLGWWGVRSFLLNPFAIGWNVLRGLWSRGPTEHLLDALADSGVPFEFVTADEEWDPGAHFGEELYLDGVLRLAVGVMMADGSAEPEEVQAVLDLTAETFPGYDRAAVADRMQSFAAEPVEVERISAGLGTLLTDEGKELVLGAALAVAAADESVDEAELDVVADVAGELGLSEDQVAGILADGAD